MRCACYDSRPVVSILACLEAAGLGLVVVYSLEGGAGDVPCPVVRSGPSCLTYLPTYLPGYLPTYYLLTYYLHTYPPTYLPT